MSEEAMKNTAMAVVVVSIILVGTLVVSALGVGSLPRNSPGTLLNRTQVTAMGSMCQGPPNCPVYRGTGTVEYEVEEGPLPYSLSFSGNFTFVTAGYSSVGPYGKAIVQGTVNDLSLDCFTTIDSPLSVTPLWAPEGSGPSGVTFAFYYTYVCGDYPFNGYPTTGPVTLAPGSNMTTICADPGIPCSGSHEVLKVTITSVSFVCYAETTWCT